MVGQTLGIWFNTQGMGLLFLEVFGKGFFVAALLIDWVLIVRECFRDRTVAGCLVSMVPIALSVVALFWLYRLFSHYERLEIFSAACARNIRNFAITLFSIQLLHPFLQHKWGTNRVVTLSAGRFWF